MCFLLFSAISILILIILYQINHQTLLLYFYVYLCPSKLDRHFGVQSKFNIDADKLRGKRVWILGSSTGIGEELAYGLARLGCRLVLTATTRSRLELVKQNCLKHSDGRLTSQDIVVCPFDLRDHGQHEQSVRQVFDTLQGVDILLVNAARVKVGPLNEMDATDWNELYQSNLLGPINMIKLVANRWRSQRHAGQIMFTSSIASILPFPLFSCYGSAKKAMEYALDTLRIEMNEHRIKVNYVNPGPVHSEIFVKMGMAPNPFEGSFNTMATDRCARLMLHALVHDLHKPLITNDLSLHVFTHMQYFVHRLTGKLMCSKFPNEKSIQQALDKYRKHI